MPSHLTLVVWTLLAFMAGSVLLFVSFEWKQALALLLMFYYARGESEFRRTSCPRQ